MNPLLLAIALAQGSAYSTTLASVSGTEFTPSDVYSGECFVQGYAIYNYSDRMPSGSGFGSPVLNLVVNSTSVNNPTSVKFKLRYATQTRGEGSVYQNDPKDKGRVRASATDATDVSFPIPRYVNGTLQMYWTEIPPQHKAKTIWYPVQLPSFVQNGGQYQAKVSVPTKYTLSASASANGAGVKKDETETLSRASLFVNVLSTYPVGSSHHATGNVASSVPAVSVDVYNTDGSFVDSYLVNSGPDDPSTYTLDFQDFQGNTVNAYYYVTGSLRTKIVFNTTSDQSYDYAPVMGDVNGDGKIDQADIDLLNANLGCTADTMKTTDASFDFNAYDLDRDGVITSADVAIAQANLGRYGDN